MLNRYHPPEEKTVSGDIVNIPKPDGLLLARPSPALFNRLPPGSYPVITSFNNRNFRKYISFVTEGEAGKIHHAPEDSFACLTVPPNETILFSNAYKPIFVVNMEDNVVYVKRDDALTPWERNNFEERKRTWGGSSPLIAYQKQAFWSELLHDWNGVTGTQYNILAKALPYYKLPQSAVRGGLVCF